MVNQILPELVRRGRTKQEDGKDSAHSLWPWLAHRHFAKSTIAQNYEMARLDFDRPFQHQGEGHLFSPPALLQLHSVHPTPWAGDRGKHASFLLDCFRTPFSVEAPKQRWMWDQKTVDAAKAALAFTPSSYTTTSFILEEAINCGPRTLSCTVPRKGD